MIEIRCPYCHKKLFEGEFVGVIYKPCPRCKKMVIVDKRPVNVI